MTIGAGRTTARPTAAVSVVTELRAMIVASRCAFVVGSLATWRVTHLLAREDGPGDVVS